MTKNPYENSEGESSPKYSGEDRQAPQVPQVRVHKEDDLAGGGPGLLR